MHNVDKLKVQHERIENVAFDLNSGAYKTLSIWLHLGSFFPVQSCDYPLLVFEMSQGTNCLLGFENDANFTIDGDKCA